jgi:hypothetical protein
MGCPTREVLGFLVADPVAPIFGDDPVAVIPDAAGKLVP